MPRGVYARPTGGPNRGGGKAFAWIAAHLNYPGDDCIAWPFSRDSGVGRGRLGYLGKMWWSHRLMCVLAHGEPPTPDHQAAHTCGNGHLACMNPHHLEWQTQAQNHRDRRKHGTARTNPYGPKSPLTLAQIAQIRALKGKQTQMATARQFGISHANVRYWQGERDKLRTGKPNVRRTREQEITANALGRPRSRPVTSSRHSASRRGGL